MYLKRLTMKGFKSFADATTLELEPGVTVVVGPNGSGKSNVVDAVTWVLGAQGPRALRSAKMEDVIFMGTASRPALGRAEVALTIDNSDGAIPVEMAEVTISRTLFRSGDSEYAINGAPCRLLDIQELLSDSGVGRQQHMIIGQGQLASVLSARPEDRRSIIEEAAGVLKHRRRKERAERRLAATQENLERLGDLVREVRRQMRPLERQAAAARNFSALDQERQALRLHLAGQDFAGFSSRAEEISSTLRAGQVAEAELRRTLAELDATASATAASLTQSSRAEELAQSVADVQSLVERSRGLSAVLTQRARGVSQALNASADVDVVASLEADSARISSEVSEVDGDLEALGPERLEFKEAEATLERVESEYEVTWGGGQEDDSIESLARATERGELLERATGVRRRAVEDLEARRDRLVARRSETAVSAEAARAAIAAAEAVVAERTTLLAAADTALDAARSAESDADNQASRAEEVATRTTARHEMLAGALDELTGSSGRQAIAEIDGVVGSLVDLLVVDAGWEKAVESAAGAAVAAVVVDGRTAAHAVLERLRREGASGLVLAAATGSTSTVEGLPAGVDLVRAHVGVRPGAPSSLAGVLDQLFGHAVRVGTLDAAIDLALDRPDLVVVTEEGDRFSTTGWRVTAGTGGVVTAQAVADAEAETEMAVLAAGTAVTLRAQARAGATEAAERRTTAQRDLDRAVAAVATEAAAEVGVLQQAARLDEELTEIHRSLEDAEVALLAEAADLEALRLTLPALEDAAARAEERASWAEQARTTLEAHRAHVIEMRQALEVRTAELSERRRALTDRLGQVERRLAGHVEARQQAADRRQRLEGDAVAIERLAASVAGITERSELLLDRRREAYAAEVQSVRASNERLEQLRRDRAAADAGLTSHLASIRALEIESAEVAVKLEAVIEMIRRDLGTEPAATVGAPAPELPEGVMPAERAAALDAEVERLGPINPLALEELSALEERHEDLDTQVTDVRTARRELQEVVRALDEEIMSTFAAAAADVNEHFSALVAMLFPGGQGRLILTEPDDLLHTGVEVEVRPLGRNVRRISLLSGGEQSMAALAFLFAVFRSRPSPFYLMDEVEAALDDVNLHRFLGLLREFRDEAQLIVVSHQKRTMETGDALYGVTMKPGGSSQVVSQKVPSRRESDESIAS